MSVKTAVLRALEIASRQHADARSDTLTTLLLMLLGSVNAEPRASCRRFCYETLEGRLTGDLLRQGYTFARLCSNEAFALVFALLAYDSSAEELGFKENTSPVLLAGLNRLFWRDAVRCEFSFSPVYDGLLRMIGRLTSARSYDQARPFVEMASRFFLAYRAPRDFPAFLREAAEPAAACLASRALASAASLEVDYDPSASAASSPVHLAAGTGREPLIVAAAGAFPRPGLHPPTSPPPSGLPSAVLPFPSAVADGVAAEDSAVAPLPLSPSSRGDVARAPVLPLFIREVSGMLLTMRSEAAVLRWLELLPALRLSRRIGAAGDPAVGTASGSSSMSMSMSGSAPSGRLPLAASDSETSADDFDFRRSSSPAGEAASARISSSAASAASAASAVSTAAARAATAMAAPAPMAASASAVAVDMQLDSHSAARLLTALDALATPGGPLYPTAQVRRAARRATAAIFPDGHGARRSVQMCFRLLHPVAILKSALCAPLRWCRRSEPAAAASGFSSVSQRHRDTGVPPLTSESPGPESTSPQSGAVSDSVRGAATLVSAAVSGRPQTGGLKAE